MEIWKQDTIGVAALRLEEYCRENYEHESMCTILNISRIHYPVEEHVFNEIRATISRFCWDEATNYYTDTTGLVTLKYVFIRETQEFVWQEI